LLELVIAKHLGADAEQLAGIVDRRQRRVRGLLEHLPPVAAASADVGDTSAATEEDISAASANDDDHDPAPDPAE
jgi:hypothetical protein